MVYLCSYLGSGCYLLKPQGKKFAIGGQTTLQAATRVNPEQASKVKLWELTRLRNEEGQRMMGKKPSSAPIISHRGSGSSMQGRLTGQRGRPGRELFATATW
jgi:hypothetical protein